VNKEQNSDAVMRAALKMAKVTLLKYGSASDELACAIVQTIRCIDEALEQPACHECGKPTQQGHCFYGCKQPAQMSVNESLEPIFWMHKIEEAPFEGHQVTVSPKQDDYYTIPIYAHLAPAQEPVGYTTKFDLETALEGNTLLWFVNKNGKYNIPLYTHPHQVVPTSTWQGLTDDEIFKIVPTIEQIKPQYGMMLSNEWNILDFARAIEQALKEKNANNN
jgi:hypothetical protein